MRLTVVALISVCATPHSSFSSRDHHAFATPPVVFIRGDRVLLEWTYGDYGYAFRPQHEMIDGQVVFWLPVVSAEQAEAGAKGELVIVDDEAVRAIERGAVFWQESDGELTKLEVERPYETQ